jgi:hypothetical protein
MSYKQQVIIQFLHKETVHATQIHRRLAEQYGFEAPNIGVNPAIAGAKTYMMIRGPEDPQVIILRPKLLHA